MPSEKTFDAVAVKLNYLDYGPEEAEPLVMLHGGAWRWQEYLSLIPSLGRRWRVLALDLRGNGRSGWAPGAYRLKDFTGDGVEFVGRLDAPAVLVGHSIGGVIALMVAARCPDKVKGLVIADVPLTLETYRQVIESSRAIFAHWLAVKQSAPSEQDLCLALAGAYGGLPGVTSGWLLFFATCLWQLDPTFFDPLLDDFDRFADGFDCEAILKTVASPILFLTGEPRLGAVMTDGEIAWLRGFPHVSCARIGGVGHLLHLENAGQAPVLTQMQAFLDRIPA